MEDTVWSDKGSDDAGVWSPQPPEYKPPADVKFQRGPTPVEPPPSVEDAKRPEETKPPESQPEKKEFVGLPVRVPGQDKVFLLKGGKRHWITTPEIFSNLGFRFGDETDIDEATLRVIPEGTPLR